MTIFSSFSANFPPHYHTILAINYVHASNRFTHLQQTWQIDGQNDNSVLTCAWGQVPWPHSLYSLSSGVTFSPLFAGDWPVRLYIDMTVRKSYHWKNSFENRPKAYTLLCIAKRSFFVHTWFILARQLFSTCSLAARRWPRNWTGANGFCLMYRWSNLD